MEKKFIVGENLLQAIANYLLEKPFKEVAGLLNEIQKLKPIDEPKD